MRQLLEKRVFRFVIAGGLNAGSTYLIYLGLAPVIGDGTGYTVAYVTGIGLSYLINSVFVFRTPMRFASALKFPLVYLAQYLLGLVFVWLFVVEWGIPRAIAMFAIISLNAVLAFFMIRFILSQKKR